MNLFPFIPARRRFVDEFIGRTAERRLTGVASGELRRYDFAVLDGCSCFALGRRPDKVGGVPVPESTLRLAFPPCAIGVTCERTSYFRATPKATLLPA